MTEEVDAHIEPELKAVLLMLDVLFAGAIQSGADPKLYPARLREIRDDEDEPWAVRGIVAGMFSALNKRFGSPETALSQ